MDDNFTPKYKEYFHEYENIDKHLLMISDYIQNYSLPKEKLYLYKYFKSKRKVALLHYLHITKTHARFRERMGFVLSYRECNKFHSLYKKLEYINSMLKSTITSENLQLLQDLESGNLNMKQINSLCYQFQNS